MGLGVLRQQHQKTSSHRPDNNAVPEIPEQANPSKLLAHPAQRRRSLFSLRPRRLSLTRRRGSSSDALAGSREDLAFCFALIADVQFGDKDDLRKDARVLRYRAALTKFRAVIQEWNSLASQKRINFAVNLGDIIDGHGGDVHRSEADFFAVMEVAGALDAPFYHLVGNHCRSVRRPLLSSTMGLPTPDEGYVSFSPGPGWRFVLVDGSEVLATAIDASASQIASAKELAQRRDLFNGAISPFQMEWLRGELAHARTKKESVILFSHFPVCASRETHRLLNAEAVLELIGEYSDVVLAFLAGHDHLGGYEVKDTVHHVTLQGLVEAPEESTAWAVVEALADGSVRIRGRGSVPSRILHRKGNALVGT